MADDFEKISGANAAVAALVALEAMDTATNGTYSETFPWPQYWSLKNSAGDFLANAAQVETPFQKGFMAAIAEYILLTCDGIFPTLSLDAEAPRWMPVATMTEAGLEEHRKEREAVE
jgi:hypothetical protein